MAWASDRVIQSVADGIDQSALVEVVDDEPVDVFEVVDLDPFDVVALASVDPFDVAAAASPLDPDPPSAPSPVVGAAFDPAAVRRSFFAQPDPLKWTAGAETALRIGPDPHSGHAAGGPAWRPWMASNRRPHAEQS